MGRIAIIEYQLPNGNWQKYIDGANKPAEIKRMLEACLRSSSWVTKARAVDADTKQLLDMAFKS